MLSASILPPFCVDVDIFLRWKFCVFEIAIWFDYTLAGQLTVDHMAIYLNRDFEHAFFSRENPQYNLLFGKFVVLIYHRSNPQTNVEALFTNGFCIGIFLQI